MCMPVEIKPVRDREDHLKSFSVEHPMKLGRSGERTTEWTIISDARDEMDALVQYQVKYECRKNCT